MNDGNDYVQTINKIFDNMHKTKVFKPVKHAYFLKNSIFS